MDFASILSSEISKKRKTVPTAAAEPTTDAPPKKYLKRSEIEAQRQAEYHAEQARLEAERQVKAAAKRAAEEAEAQRREAVKEKQRRLAEERRKREEERLGITKDETPPKEGEVAEMTEEEAIAKLRELGEPMKLFGESLPARIKRIKRLTAAREASEVVPLPAMSEEEMVIDPKDVKGNSELVYRQLDSWFRLVLKEWGKALDERPLAVKESLQGRKAAGAMQDAVTQMGPLFKHFRNRDLQNEVFLKVCELVIEAQGRRYVKANDVYLRLSIGNAAWPIGVTMVGIHERSAREKLHEHQTGQAAHIMSDEVTRKFLQSIKRCLSFCQTRWPPEDPLQLMG